MCGCLMWVQNEMRRVQCEQQIICTGNYRVLQAMHRKQTDFEKLVAQTYLLSSLVTQTPKSSVKLKIEVLHIFSRQLSSHSTHCTIWSEHKCKEATLPPKNFF